MKLWVCFPIPATLCLFLSREEIARPYDQIIKAWYHIVEGGKKVWNINSWRHTYWQSCKRRSCAASAHASLRRSHWNVHNPRTCNFPQRATQKQEESMCDSGNWWEGNASGRREERGGWASPFSSAGRSQTCAFHIQMYQIPGLLTPMVDGGF